VEKRISKYEFIQINSQVFQLIRRATFLTLVMVAGTYLVRLTSVPILEKILHALLIIFLAIPAKNFLVIAISYLQNTVARRTENRIDDIIFELLTRFSGFIILATAIIIALDLLGVNVMPFIAGAGVAGVAIGFAAKDTLSNLIAGILLIIDRPFEVGDRIEVWSAPAGTATWGDVIDIGLRATKIKTTDNIVIIIPNNEIMLRDIINYTTITGKIRVRINIGVAYDADIQMTKDIILKVADSAVWVAKHPPAAVVVKKFGDSSVDLQLRVWIDDARKRMHTISYITDKVKTAFDEQGIEIPYPKRDIYIKGKI
jgi:small-conductance mechanosensitive channel